MSTKTTINVEQEPSSNSICPHAEHTVANVLISAEQGKIC